MRVTLPRTFSSHLRALVLLTNACALLLAARPARAQSDIRTPLGARGSLVIDTISGFRASSIGGVGYASPIGFTTQNVSEDIPSPNPNAVGGTDSFHYTTFWIAPSADYFIIDHLSIGGLIEVATTSTSLSETLNNTTTTTNVPATTNLTFLPRVGWMFAISDRFGIWPRAGLGYASRSGPPLNAGFVGLVPTNVTDTVSGFVFDVDCGFLYRINQVFFLKGAPEITLVPGSDSRTAGNVTTSTGASTFAFTIAGGIGVNLNL